MIKGKLPIILILILAFLVRLIGITNYPAGFNADEAALGYNAYSLLKTGNDEHGNAWPLHFQSFNDYKPGGYVYLVLPFVALFGLNEIAVRLPSLIFSLLAIYVCFLLGEHLSSSKKLLNLGLGEIFAFLVAINPWQIHFSRGAWETNIASFFILFGVYCILKSRLRPVWLWPGLIAFIFSLYTYHSARMVVPLLVISLLPVYYQILHKSRKQLGLILLIGLVLLLPLAFSFIKTGGSARFSGVGLFADLGPYADVIQARSEHQPTTLVARLIHNRPLAYFMRFAQNYGTHFDPQFLFISGDPIPRNNIPEAGQFYYLDIVFAAIGLLWWFKNKKPDFRPVFIWLLLAPIASALTFQSPHAIRAHNLLYPYLFFVSLGLCVLFTSDLLIRFRKLLLGLLIMLYLFNFGFFLNQYFLAYPRVHPDAWEYGFKDLVNYVSQVQDKYQKIYITDAYDQPYILFLFYLRYPPAAFQQEGVLTPRDKFGFSTVRDFSKYHFEKIDLTRDQYLTNSLICGTPGEMGRPNDPVKQINFINSDPAFICLQR